MDEAIKARTSFTEEDIDIKKTGTIEYEVYEYTPAPDDFVMGEERENVFRNTRTGGLESIKYVLSGGVPYENRPGCYWFWGKVIADGYNSYLTFYFDGEGNINKIAVSFAAPEPSREFSEKRNKEIKYAAQFTNWIPKD